ncbi:MAG: hypothetical protein U1E15_01150 [Hyphomicrobiales bacterium]
MRTEVGDSQSEIAWLLPVIGGVLGLAIYLTAQPAAPAFTGVVSDDEALGIVQSRCVACHAAKPTEPAITQAPKGIMLETLDAMRQHKDQIITQAVANKAMPLGNKTGMTDDERAKLGAWLAKQ